MDTLPDELLVYIWKFMGNGGSLYRRMQFLCACPRLARMLWGEINAIGMYNMRVRVVENTSIHDYLQLHNYVQWGYRSGALNFTIRCTEGDLRNSREPGAYKIVSRELHYNKYARTIASFGVRGDILVDYLIALLGVARK